MMDSRGIIFGDEKKEDGQQPFISDGGLKVTISKMVVRKKLAKQRHLVIDRGINPEYLDSLFPALLELFKPQIVNVSLRVQFETQNTLDMKLTT